MVKYPQQGKKCSDKERKVETMRKEARETKQVTLERIQGYHEGYRNGNYAFQGYTENKYFTSDRYIKLDENFQRPDGKPLQGFGLEIETECRTITDETVLANVMKKVVFELFPADLFKMQRDGSLAGNTSVECITQPMTREFIRNHYNAFKAMYDSYYPSLGLVCGDSCGMHVNISNAIFGTDTHKQQEAIKKLLYIVNHHFNLIAALTARNIRQTTYCGRMSQYAVMDGAKNANLDNMPSSHGNCCNFSHYPEGRVKLRIVGGQRTFGSFRNTMESVFHLCAAVKSISWKDCDDITKIFAGCNRYVYDRLKTLCYTAGTITLEQLETIKNTVDMETRYL